MNSKNLKQEKGRSCGLRIALEVKGLLLFRSVLACFLLLMISFNPSYSFNFLSSILIPNQIYIIDVVITMDGFTKSIEMFFQFGQYF